MINKLTSLAMLLLSGAVVLVAWKVAETWTTRHTEALVNAGMVMVGVCGVGLAVVPAAIVVSVLSRKKEASYYPPPAAPTYTPPPAYTVTSALEGARVQKLIAEARSLEMRNLREQMQPQGSALGVWQDDIYDL